MLFEHHALSPQMTLHLSYWVGWLILEGSPSQVQVNWEQLHSVEQLRIRDKKNTVYPWNNSSIVKKLRCHFQLEIKRNKTRVLLCKRLFGSGQDLIIRAQSTAIFLCIQPFSSWWRTITTNRMILEQACSWPVRRQSFAKSAGLNRIKSGNDWLLIFPLTFPTWVIPNSVRFSLKRELLINDVFLKIKQCQW